LRRKLGVRAGGSKALPGPDSCDMLRRPAGACTRPCPHSLRPAPRSGTVRVCPLWPACGRQLSVRALCCGQPAPAKCLTAAAPERRSCSSTKKRCSSFQTTSGGANRLGTPMRSAVSSSIVLSPISGRNCVGTSRQLIGQRRVPEPPDKMTGAIRSIAKIKPPYSAHLLAGFTEKS